MSEKFARKCNNKKDKNSYEKEAIDSEENCKYTPLHFLRLHSKSNDPTDIQSPVWDVVFEPDPYNSSRTTSVVATCGGNSICIVDVISGLPRMKYKHTDSKENFFTLAWSTLTLDDDKSNILASGGIKGEIRLFHPEHKVCYHVWQPVSKKNTPVNSLVFHTSEHTWLFCGTDDGLVTLWDVGTPTLPSYDDINPCLLMKLFPDYGHIYCVVWSGHESKWLLAGTAAGLVGWRLDTDSIKKTPGKYRPVLVEFLLPESKEDNGEFPIVDSVGVVSEWSIVTKCALHGLLYLWDLKKSTQTLELQDKEHKLVIEKSAEMLSVLKWSDTDNYFMNLSCHKDVGLVLCGDDVGSVWMYNTVPLPQQGTVDPTIRLMWPELQDDHLENSRKVPLDRHSIVINSVASSWDSNYIVAVTSTNMVCIWRLRNEGMESGV